MKQKRKLGRKLLSFLLTLAMVIGLMPGMGLTVLAEGTTYSPASEYTDYGTLNSNDTTVQIEGVKIGDAIVDWYVIGYDSTDKTVTLLSKTSFGNTGFNSHNSVNNYESSEIETFVEGLTGDGQPLAGIKGALANISVTGDPSISGAVPYLLSTIEADALDSTKKGTDDIWWLRSPGNSYDTAACVEFGNVRADGLDVHFGFAVRPALQLNLESVIFKSESGSYSFALKPAGYSVTLSGGANATTSGGATSQTGLTGAMTTVTYTANTGYYFAEFADITDNGITAKRTSSTVVTASGTPTADATITVPDAVAIPTYEVTYKIVNGTWSDNSTTDKTETVQSGSKPASVPTGMKAAEGYTGGSWDKNPADTTITEATTFTYTFTEKQKVATPTFSPAAGTYTAAQSVEISCTTDGAEIYYTTDGSNPSASSTAYSGAITVGETTTIKAIAVKEGMTDSSVASTTYTISEGPEPSEETEVRVEDHLSDDSISDDLKNSDFNTVSKIEDALETALSITTEEEKERSKLVDVKLMISTDGGIHWNEATVQNFPAGGIDVVLPYPNGTNGDEYSFSVAHMIGTSANGKTAGEIEKPGTTNTSSGISTHFNGLSPVMITWTKNSSPSKKDDSKSKEKAHTHHYVWETIEATEDSDGELRYKCDICGDIQTRVPITAYYVFNKNTTDKIRKAGQGATVKIETSRFISFHKMVMDALAERPDVTLEISFLDGEYKGNRVTVTIPAGTDALSLLDENGFVGFLYLASKYGYTLDN